MALKALCGPNKVGHAFVCCDKNDPEMQEDFWRNVLSSEGISKLRKIVKDKNGNWKELKYCKCTGSPQEIADCEKKHCQDMEILPNNNHISRYNFCKYYLKNKVKREQQNEFVRSDIFEEIYPDCPNKTCDDSFFNTIQFYENRKYIFGGTAFYVYSCCVLCFVIILLFFVMF
jgi:hypothetical protein